MYTYTPVKSSFTKQETDVRGSTLHGRVSMMPYERRLKVVVIQRFLINH